MNQKIYKIKSDIKLFLKEIEENTELVYKSIVTKDKAVNEDTIKYCLLDIQETVEVLNSLFEKLESEYENEQL